MTRSRTRTWTLSAGLFVGALVGGSLALAASGRPDQPTSDFPTVLAEMRSAVASTADIRTRADRGGDRIKETCAYERLRGMMQAVESTQIAQVAWEGAKARGDEAAATAEMQRAQQALELVRRMRAEADNCVGRELERGAGIAGQTVVTVESNVPDDDPNAGPREGWVIRPPRLDLPESLASVAASQF